MLTIFPNTIVSFVHSSIHSLPLSFVSSKLTYKLSHFTLLHMSAQVSAVISIPLWQWFLQRFGKKTAAFCGITVSKLVLFL